MHVGKRWHDDTVARVRTKICGIRSIEDLNVAVEAGADAIGVIVGTTHLSEDELSAARAHEICTAAPAFISTVLVTHLPDPDEILHLADVIGVDTIQVHGDDVSADSMQTLWRRRRSLRVIRTVHVTGPCAIEAAREAATSSHAVLLDTRTATRLGGTGRTHDWRISRSIARVLGQSGHRVILAGGLDGTNVASAIRMVGPYGVDANSRLRGANGRHDPIACEAFVAAAGSPDIAIRPDKPPTDAR